MPEKQCFILEEEKFVNEISVIKKAIKNGSVISFALSLVDEPKISKESDSFLIVEMFPLVVFNQRDFEGHVSLCGVVKINDNFFLRNYTLNKLKNIQISQDGLPAWELGWDGVVDYNNMPPLSKEYEIASYDWKNWGKRKNGVNFKNCNKAYIAILKNDTKKFIWLPEKNLQYWNIGGKIKVTNIKINKNAVKIEEVLETGNLAKIGDLISFPKGFSIIQKFVIIDIDEENINTPVKALLIDEKETIEIDFPYNVVA